MVAAGRSAEIVCLVDTIVVNPVMKLIVATKLTSGAVNPAQSVSAAVINAEEIAVKYAHFVKRAFKGNLAAGIGL